MPLQQYIAKAMVVLNSPAGLVILAVFAAGCIALLKMNANHR